jgi:hypothetical protein
MKYSVEMGSGATKYIASFIKIGSGIQKLLVGGLYNPSLFVTMASYVNQAS